MSRLEQALALHQQGALEQAMAAYETILQCEPDNSDAWHLSGLLYFQSGHSDEAQKNLEKALQLNGQSVLYLKNYAKVCEQSGLWQQMLVSYQKLLQLEPTNAAFHSGLGRAYFSLQDYESALATFQLVCDRTPNNANAWVNLGNTLTQLAHVEEGCVCFQKALALEPHHGDAHTNLGLSYLLLGRLNEGFEEYEWRFQTAAPVQLNPSAYPLWQGQDLSDATLVVQSEGGVGDALMQAGCFRALLKCVKQLVVECDERFFPIWQRTFPGMICTSRHNPQSIDHLVAGDIFRVPGGSLYRTVIDDKHFFAEQQLTLRADPELTRTLRQRYQVANKPVIGLSWATSHGQFAAKNNIPLEDLKPLLAIPQVQFVSLQYDLTPEAYGQLPETIRQRLYYDEQVNPLYSLEAALAQVAACDRVISADNCLLPMAGALNVDCLGLLPKLPNPIWHLCGQDSPWFPSLTLIRQTTNRDWREPLQQVTDLIQG